MPPPTIPSIEEILSCKDILSDENVSQKVVRFGDTVVKYGGTTSPAEAANQAYVAQQGNIPVPKIYAHFTDPERNKTFIVMQYIEGTTLEKALPTLNAQERRDVVSQLRDILQELRSLKDPGYIGCADHLPCQDGVFYDCSRTPTNLGPFSSQDEFYEAMAGQFEGKEPESYMGLIRKLTARMPRHKIVFTHGDLQAKNVMIQQTHEIDGLRKFKLTLVDWANGGWYPAYWELCNATITGRFRPEWAGVIHDVFSGHNYEYEWLYMDFIRHLVFW